MILILYFGMMELKHDFSVCYVVVQIFLFKLILEINFLFKLILEIIIIYLN